MDLAAAHRLLELEETPASAGNWDRWGRLSQDEVWASDADSCVGPYPNEAWLRLVRVSKLIRLQIAEYG